MPTLEQLDKMAFAVLNRKFGALNGPDGIKVMELTIAAMQAKALADIAYLQGFDPTPRSVASPGYRG